MIHDDQIFGVVQCIAHESLYGSNGFRAQRLCSPWARLGEHGMILIQQRHCQISVQRLRSRVLWAVQDVSGFREHQPQQQRFPDTRWTVKEERTPSRKAFA